MRNARTWALARRLALSALVLSCLAAPAAVAEAPSGANKVELSKDDQGWRLFVDGAAMPVHGVVWSYVPPGENFTYDLFRQDKTFIARMIDRDFSMLKAMGVNVVRVFTLVPPEWVEYIYKRYGIMSIINYDFGRYGVSVGGIWYPTTDYSDRHTRAVIKQKALETVAKYKDVPGVLMFLFGNENNYGLEWGGSAIKDLPKGAMLEVNAGYLYSLFGEAIAEAKKLDPGHPMGIVNGDIQYLHVIKAMCPNIDILGANVYRGEACFDLFYQSVADELDRPIVFTELGADAYNVATQQEDQASQAALIRSQWKEIYEQSWGKGKTGNCLGGFLFEWVDEWWKHGMTEGLDVHDTRGTWTNGGYRFDAIPGAYNMNEEWFGICAQGRVAIDGIPVRIPRAAYYMMLDLWKLPQYGASAAEVAAHFGALRVEPYVARAEGALLRDSPAAPEPWSVGGGFGLGLLEGGYDVWEDWAAIAASGLARGSLTVRFAPILSPHESLEGYITLVATPSYEKSLIRKTTEELRAGPDVELYGAEAAYENADLRVAGYYHSGHPDWATEGDFFFLLPEAFDLPSFDRAKSKAPFGVELELKSLLPGLVVYAGPELFMGARPRVMVKYAGGMKDLAWALVLDEELSATSLSAGAGSGADPSFKGSVGGSVAFLPWLKVDAALLFSSPEKVGDLYEGVALVAPGAGYLGTDLAITTGLEVGYLDCLAGRIRLATDIFRYTTIWAEFIHAGLVADYRAAYARGGTQLADVGTGNRDEVRAGLTFIYGDLTLQPLFLYRKPIEAAVPAIGIYSPRTALADPFFVYDNREALQAELVASWDPEGATWFHDWNNADRESAPFAASISFLYSFYLGQTDARTFYLADGVTLAAFAAGLDEVYGMWSLKARAVWNPGPDARLIFTATAGRGQSYGMDGRIVTYFGGTLDARLGDFMLGAGATVDGWGPEPYYREFNITYPLQWYLDLALGFGPPSFLDRSDRVGLRIAGRTMDSFSDADWGGGANLHLIEASLYFNIAF